MADSADAQSMFARAVAPHWTVLELLSSVRFGIAQLVTLFVYCWLGSAGLFYPVIADGGIEWRHQMIRQWRAFELTEFEWFHTWFFFGLCATICLTMAVTTIRRIPFNALKAGVWMIHAGVILLAIGSAVYFATKVEGDTPVLRRQVVATLPDGASVALPAVVGAHATLSGDAGTYQLRVVSVLPGYELRTEGFTDAHDYAVQVMVQRTGGDSDASATFIRQLLAQHPQFTEDVIPGEGRVKKIARFKGAVMLGDPIELSLELAPQDTFWIMDSWALHMREAGENAWTQRVIPGGGGRFAPGRGLPRYNDYFASTVDIWPPAGAQRVAVDPLNVNVPGGGDALGDIDVRVTGFLRYAVMQSRRVPTTKADRASVPMVDMVLTLTDGQQFRYQLAALEGENRELDGRLGFEWLDTPGDLELWRARLAPGEVTFLVLDKDGAAPYQVSVPVSVEAAVDGSAPFAELGDTGFAYRLRQVVDALEIRPGESASFAIFDIRTPEGTITMRAAAADPQQTADIDASAHDAGTGMTKPDPRIVTLYRPGAHEQLLLVGGPRAGATDDTPVKLIRRTPGGAVLEHPLRVGDGVTIQGGVTLRLARYVPHSSPEMRPLVIAPEQRDKQAQDSNSFSMIRIQLTPKNGDRIERWLPFHRYVFDDGVYAGAGLSRIEPTTIALPDGRTVELALGRERRTLPTPVALENFVLTSHIGGFTGSTASVRDWMSVLRPAGAGDDALVKVSVNAPHNVGGVWLFQSFWDAPRGGRSAGDPGSPGFGFTGLGVGTRHGVVTALLGAILSCMGMVYTFYVKPIIRRRRRVAIERTMARGSVQA